jgi:hypothetical protein
MAKMTKIEGFTTNFTAKQSLSLETSFGRIKAEDDVELEGTIGYRAEDDYGWFEFYDVESGGEEWYAEGGLWFEGNELTDYDGVFSLPPFIFKYLKSKGFNVDEMYDESEDDGLELTEVVK